MRLERSFRGSDESSTFDWQRPARELDVPLDVARALYLRATRFADDPRRAEVLYLRWLRDAAEARRPVLPAAVPGRQTRVEREAQGLTLANQPDAPVGDTHAPPASAAQAPVPHQPPEMKPVPQPASTGNAYVDTFSAPLSKQAMELWGKTGTEATTQAAADQAKFDAALPPMPVHLDGGEPKGAKGSGPGGKPAAKPPAAGTPPPAAQPTPTLPVPPVTAGAIAARSFKPSADRAQMKADGQKVIDNLPTTAPDVKTDPGPAPVTDLAGQADPVRTISDHDHALGESAKALDTAKQKVISGPGTAAVQPVKLDEKLNVPKEQSSGEMPQLPTVEGMAKMKQWNLPSNALAAFDTVAKPKMDASLAQAKAKMTDAEHKRDVDRTKAVSDAQDKVKQAHADADKQQQAKVADARTRIANHQADTLVKHEAKIKKLDQQSGTKKSSAISKINDRISADQAKVQTDYQDAQKKAEDKKKQGEEDAKKKKEEAEKKKDESFWDQVGDAISDGIKAIADEIDKALEAIGKAIGEILDAVKDAACKVIDAARDFVCQALTEFGDWLKSAVDALIGSVFPELAAALDHLIDQAVNAAKAAVNTIADGLKKAVTALCDGLKGALDGIIAAFKAAVQAAATFAQAAVTGNWALVGKMILDGILNALGIDPAAFYALIGEAEDSIEKIIANPGAFVGHLIDAVKLGFKQFGANFWTHLKDGLVQWLFGTFASAGITMPASFDIAGIFDLVCQVLGLTWPRLRGKVVKLIGEKNTERLEFVAQYVQALITGGFAGLWEKIEGDLSNLWDMVVGGIRDWLIQSVVMAAIEKIATMWNPAGAIFELIKTAWNVYQWVRENAQRIFGLVKAVVDSISNIVAGNIGGAANFIEASLAQLVPVAISLFADLLGLGGLADKIREIIEKVQEKVDHAIDKLIERVLGLFKGKDGMADDKKADDKKTDGDEVPTSLAEPAPATVKDPSPGLAAALQAAPRGTTIIYQGAETDPRTVTKTILAEHNEASFEKASGRLTLPPMHAGPLAEATTLQQLGQLAAQQTGVSKVSLEKTETEATLVGQVNPAITFAQLSLAAGIDQQDVQDALDEGVRTAQPDWAAVFATGGKVIINEKGDQKPLKLRDVISKATLQRALAGAILQTFKISDNSTLRQDIINRGRNLSTVASQRATEIADAVADKTLIYINQAKLPRNVRSGPLVRINPNATKTDALYRKIAESSSNELLNKMVGELHHVLPLYLGGSHEEDSLIQAEGKARIAGTAHNQLHEQINQTDLTRFLKTSVAVTLTPEDLAKHFKPNGLDLLIGELQSDTATERGLITYRKATEFKPVKLEPI